MFQKLQFSQTVSDFLFQKLESISKLRNYRKVPNIGILLLMQGKVWIIAPKDEQGLSRA